MNKRPTADIKAPISWLSETRKAYIIAVIVIKLDSVFIAILDLFLGVFLCSSLSLFFLLGLFQQN